MNTKASLLMSLLLTPAMPAVADPADDGVNQLVQSYYHAFHTGSISELRSLIYPASLKCIDEAAPHYFEQDISLSVPNAVATSPDWQATDMTPLKAMPQFAQLPVVPERAIQIAWKEGEGTASRNELKQLLIAQDNGHYVQVLPCPTAEQVKTRDAFFTRHSQ